MPGSAVFKDAKISSLWYLLAFSGAWRLQHCPCSNSTQTVFSKGHLHQTRSKHVCSTLSPSVVSPYSLRTSSLSLFPLNRIMCCSCFPNVSCFSHFLYFHISVHLGSRCQGSRWGHWHKTKETKKLIRLTQTVQEEIFPSLNFPFFLSVLLWAFPTPHPSPSGNLVWAGAKKCRKL